MTLFTMLDSFLTNSRIIRVSRLMKMNTKVQVLGPSIKKVAIRFYEEKMSHIDKKTYYIDS